MSLVSSLLTCVEVDCLGGFPCLLSDSDSLSNVNRISLLFMSTCFLSVSLSLKRDSVSPLRSVSLSVDLVGSSFSGSSPTFSLSVLPIFRMLFLDP